MTSRKRNHDSKSVFHLVSVNVLDVVVVTVAALHVKLHPILKRVQTLRMHTCWKKKVSFIIKNTVGKEWLSPDRSGESIHHQLDLVFHPLVQKKTTLTRLVESKTRWKFQTLTVVQTDIIRTVITRTSLVKNLPTTWRPLLPKTGYTMVRFLETEGPSPKDTLRGTVTKLYTHSQRVPQTSTRSPIFVSKFPSTVSCCLKGGVGMVNVFTKSWILDLRTDSYKGSLSSVSKFNPNEV